MQNELTDETFWNNYWKSVKLPSQVQDSFSFDRCLSGTLKKRIEAIGVKGKILEIGAAPGKWLAYFTNLGGYYPSGLDYSKAGIEALVENFKLLNITPEDTYIGDFFQIEPTEKYDIVMSLGFVEHFEDPLKVIERHLLWLKPGGVLIIGVPNFNSVHGVVQYFLNKSILKVHNLKIMNLRFFKKLESMLPVKLYSVEYLGSLEASLPIDNEEKHFKKLLPRLFLKACYHFRKFKFTDNINSPLLSSYILAIYQKTA